jgi:hypothetical protein
MEVRFRGIRLGRIRFEAVPERQSIEIPFDTPAGNQELTLETADNTPEGALTFYELQLVEAKPRDR